MWRRAPLDIDYRMMIKMMMRLHYTRRTICRIVNSAALFVCMTSSCLPSREFMPNATGFQTAIADCNINLFDRTPVWHALLKFVTSVYVQACARWWSATTSRLKALRITDWPSTLTLGWLSTQVNTQRQPYSLLYLSILTIKYHEWTKPKCTPQTIVQG